MTSEGETANCEKAVCDPSYLPDKVQVGKVVRAICIMSHPIPDTHNFHSVQVILPQKQLGYKSDILCIDVRKFIEAFLESGKPKYNVNLICSYVAPKGKYIAFVSTEAEIDNPKVELKPGIDLLGPVDEIFFNIYDRYAPTNNHGADNCFISASYDPTTHFETTVNDVIQMYSEILERLLIYQMDLSAASAAEPVAPMQNH
ncbi:hypothetical protein CRYUN_Cryun10bG0100000 [Craigia yunnanensis]